MAGLERAIQVGPAFQCFLNHYEYFGPRFPNEIINPHNYYLEPLMNSLPHARNGLMLKSTAIVLFYVYIKNNNLAEGNTVIPDDIIKHCFDGEIPAQYYYDENRHKILMTTAVDDGFIEYPLNTFDTIRIHYPNFNSNEFKNHFFQNIIGSNSNYVDVSPQILTELEQEYNIIKATSEQWNNLLRQQSQLTLEQQALFEDYMSPPDIKEPGYF
jgi:hypothetical protein